MYGTSYKRCLCFVFLVILAILSFCSGFRIDSHSMTDYNNRNYPVASLPLQPEVYAVERTPNDVTQLRHRVRHHHRAIRAHSGDGPRRNGKNRPASSCQKQDISQKAFLANTVVVARTESFSVKPHSHKYSVLFRVQKKLKFPSAFPKIDDLINISFLNETWRTHHRCGPDRNPLKLVRANIQPSREYLLFLNSHGARNYTPIGSPELIRRHKVPKVVQRITHPKFKIKPPRGTEIRSKTIAESNDRKRRLRLVCSSRGLPIPTLSWSHNDILVRPNQRIKITYKKRSSTLIITEPTKNDQGRYECTARGVGGKSDSAQFDFHDSSVHSVISEATDQPCASNMTDYCYNGGKCWYIMKMQEMYCVCPDGYTGQQCNSKLPSQPSMYPSPPSLYTCKIGLSTRYFC